MIRHVGIRIAQCSRGFLADSTVGCSATSSAFSLHGEMGFLSALPCVQESRDAFTWRERISTPLDMHNFSVP